jgi:hypothetical protein
MFCYKQTNNHSTTKEMQKNYKLGSKPPNLMLTGPKIHLQQQQLIDSINKNMQKTINILSQLFSSPRKKPIR